MGATVGQGRVEPTTVVLIQVDDETWTALGSLNGGEVSHTLNREVVVVVDDALVYARPREVFLHD